MSVRPMTRACPTPRSAAALALPLCAALLLVFAAPASAVDRAGAADKALSALGTTAGTEPVVVFGSKKPLRAGTRVTQASPRRSSRRVARVGGERAFLFYEDSGPFQPYAHPGRVALVGAKSGKVKLSRTIMWPPLVHGNLPKFLRSLSAYKAAEYRVFYRGSSTTAPGAPGVGWPLFSDDPFAPLGGGASLNTYPKADEQDTRVKRNVPKRITLTGSDDDGDLLTFAITNPPTHGTLSGQPPDVIYTPDANYLGKDKFAFKATDGEFYSNTAHVSIDVVPLGSPPTVTTSAGCTAYTEQSPAVFVDALLTATDPDDTLLDSARVRISADFVRGDDLGFTDQNGIIGSYDDQIGVLTLTGTASVADYQTALRSVRYRNLAGGSPSATKDVEFTVNDAGSDSAPATKQVCITEGGASDNNRPIGETSEGALSYVENDGPLPIDAGFVVNDPDSASLAGATVKFTPSQPSEEEEIDPGDPGEETFTFAPDEDELGFEDQNGITGSYDDETGILTLTGTASVADYEAAIRSVTYENSSEDPSDAPRAVRFQLTDTNGANSTPGARGIFVTPVNDAPVATTTEGSGSYVGDDQPVTIDAELTAIDVDDDDLESARVQISSGFEPGDELGFDDQLGISGSYDSEAGVLTLSGTAPVADYETALRSVTFGHTEGNASGSRTIEFVVNDGDLDSAPASKGIEVNDKPVVDTSDDALSYSEGAGAVAVDAELTVTDADSATLQGATVQISSGYSAGEDQLVFADQLGITGVQDGETGALTLSGAASVADYETALRSITYENSSENPSTDTRTISFQVDDGGTSNNLSDAATRDIAVTPVNDAPVVTTSDGSTSYMAGDPPVTVDANLTVTDVDDTSIESAQVRISSGFEPGDELIYVDQLGIAGDYDTDTGVLTLTGTAAIADYEAALLSVQYSHTGDNPSPSRTVEFTVNDGDVDSAAALKSIDVSTPPTGEAPVVTTSAGSTSYTLGDAVGVEADNLLTVTDADDTNIEGGQVQIVGFEPGDDLVFANQLGITGNFDSETGLLTLSGPAPVADYETALRSVKFRHFGDNVEATRTLEFKVNDGDFDSNTAPRTIDVVPPPL
jgi:hypothetical protein